MSVMDIPRESIGYEFLSQTVVAQRVINQHNRKMAAKRLAWSPYVCGTREHPQRAVSRRAFSEPRALDPTSFLQNRVRTCCNHFSAGVLKRARLAGPLPGSNSSGSPDHSAAGGYRAGAWAALYRLPLRQAPLWCPLRPG